jgi:hypothetical protein
MEDSSPHFINGERQEGPQAICVLRILNTPSNSFNLGINNPSTTAISSLPLKNPDVTSILHRIVRAIPTIAKEQF